MSQVFLAIPIRGMHSEACHKTRKCLELLKAHSKHGIEVQYARGQQITQNSFHICDRFLRGKWDYLVYTGDDIVFPPWAVDRLIEHDADIASAVCTWKSPPYWVPAMKLSGGKPKHFMITRSMVENNVVVELDLVGSGFIVVKRRVVEGIQDFLRDKVYPSIPDEYKWLSAVPFFPATYDPRMNAIMSSDFSFCRMAKQAMNAKVIMDCGIICRHRHESEYDITHHWDWINRHGFSQDEERFFGDTGTHITAREADIYWGDMGEPVPIAVTSAGNEYHALNHVLPVLRGEWEEPKTLVNKHELKAGYIIGFHVSEQMQFEDYIRWADQFSRVLIHWVGSDMLNLGWMNDARKAVLNGPKFAHLVEDERGLEKMREYFSDITVLPLTTTNEYSVCPLPKNFSVAVYYPKHRHDFHYGDVLKGVIEAMPDVEFRLYHLFGEPPDFKYPNMAWLGSLQGGLYPDMLARSSCMLRLSQHDGRPFSIAEIAMMGRRFVTNFDLPFTHRVPDVPTVESVVEALREIQKETEPDRQAAEHYRQTNNGRVFRDAIERLAGLSDGKRAEYDYREYWEGRYSNGPRGAGGPVPLSKEAEFINEQVTKAIKGAECDTVLDVGCGSMVRWERLPVKPENYRGCDVSSQAVQYAAERFPKAQFFVADITKDPLPAADAVIALDVLPHIKPVDFRATVGKIFHTAQKLVVLKVAMNVDDGHYQHNVPLPSEWGVVELGWSGRAYHIPDNKVAKLWVFARQEEAVVVT